LLACSLAGQVLGVVRHRATRKKSLGVVRHRATLKNSTLTLQPERAVAE
jgi:hypothetical protein